MNKRLPLRVTAQMLKATLADDLYLDLSACLWELIRNGACAQMSDPKVWQPGVGRVDVSFETSFPFFKAARYLVVLDQGRGFIESDLERFCHLGPSQQDLRNNPKGGNGGASQKRIGRFAALALNREKDQNAGFFVVTRTKAAKSVTVIPVIPALIEEHQGMDTQTFAEDAPELGFLANRSGSFTAIVIPNPVFDTYDQVRLGLAWRLPRKRSQSFKLVVGGVEVKPPPLATRLNVTVGEIEMFIDKRHLSDEPGGIWLTDKVSGLRVVQASRLWSHLPSLFASLDLVGDIFIPDILANQDTSRGGLSSRYLRSSEWKWVVGTALAAHHDKLKALLGVEEKSRSPVQDSLRDLAQMCNAVFGPPKVLVDDDAFPSSLAEESPGKPDRSVGAHKLPVKREPRPAGQNPVATERPKRPQVQGTNIKIGDTTYTLVTAVLDHRIFAEVDGNRIGVNERGYSLLPAAKDVRQEHVLSMVFFAVARSLYPDSVDAALKWVSEIRMDLAKKKSEKK